MSVDSLRRLWAVWGLTVWAADLVQPLLELQLRLVWWLSTADCPYHPLCDGGWWSLRLSDGVMIITRSGLDLGHTDSREKAVAGSECWQGEQRLLVLVGDIPLSPRSPSSLSNCLHTQHSRPPRPPLSSFPPLSLPVDLVCLTLLACELSHSRATIDVTVKQIFHINGI